MAAPAQLDLFGRGQPQFDPAFSRLKRQHLAGDAWLDLAPGWLQGDQALFDSLAASTRFRSERRLVYERVVEVPRLSAVLGEDGPIPALVTAIQRALSERYQEQFTRISLGYYRTGQDSVAFHGDRIARTSPASADGT